MKTRSILFVLFSVCLASCETDSQGLPTPNWFVIGLVILVAVLFVLLYAKERAYSSWQHLFEHVDFSAMDFYNSVRAALKEKGLEKLSVGTKTFMESNIFSDRREYLSISFGDYTIYVCAAPFGTGTFVSWWLCLKDDAVVNKIPILSRLWGMDRNNMTFYEIDTEIMYKTAVHDAILSVVGQISEAKGYRKLTEFERQFNNKGK